MIVHFPAVDADNVDMEEIQQLEDWMRSAAKQSLTPEEYRAQEESWVIGMMPRNSKMSREEIKEILNEQHGPVQS